MKVGDSLNINLLPSQVKFQADKIKLKNFRHYEAIALGGWLVFLVGALVLFFGSGLILKQNQKKYQQAVNVFKVTPKELY